MLEFEQGAERRVRGRGFSHQSPCSEIRAEYTRSKLGRESVSKYQGPQQSTDWKQSVGNSPKW